MPANRCDLMRDWRTEPALFLYMFASFIKFPVFQNLLFEKSCYQIYQKSSLIEIRVEDADLCANVSKMHDDKEVQAAANHLFFLSSLTLTLPSIPSSLILGYLVDKKRVRLCLIIPLTALVLSTMNYVILSFIPLSSPYLLLFSDFIFGIAGGYTSIIGVSVAYTMQGTGGHLRSTRIARLEGSIGLGGTLGYAFSGFSRKILGYTGVFLLMLSLQLMAIVYVLLGATEVKENNLENDERSDLTTTSSSNPSMGDLAQNFFLSPFSVVTRTRPHHIFLLLNIFAFSIELFGFAGLTDIQYSFLRYRLAWDDETYGWFSGLSYALATFGVIFIYPQLRNRLLSDADLGAIALFIKIVFLLLLSLSTSTAFTLALSLLSLAARFVSTAFRALIANLVKEHEQGRISSLLSILEGLTGLLATAVFNNLYPLTLTTWSGICPVVIATLLFAPLSILMVTGCQLRSEEDTSSADSTGHI